MGGVAGWEEMGVGGDETLRGGLDRRELTRLPRRLCRWISSDETLTTAIRPRPFWRSESCGIPNSWNPKLVESQTCGSPNLWNPKSVESQACGIPNLRNPKSGESQTCGIPSLGNRKSAGPQTCGIPNLWKANPFPPNPPSTGARSRAEPRLPGSFPQPPFQSLPGTIHRNC